MIGQPVVGFPVSSENLTFIEFETAVNILVARHPLVASLNYKKLFSVPEHLPVARVKGAFAHRKVVNGIQQVCFSLSVVANKAVDLGVKFQLNLSERFEVNGR
jgi:hypothetical protein